MKKILVGLGVFFLTAIGANWALTPLANTIDAETTLIKQVGVYEEGFDRLEDGTYRVAARTAMPGVSANMVRWWFTTYLQTTEHYKSWHPTDHVWMDWENKKPGAIIGASHLVHEYIGKDLLTLRIQFVDPTEFFGYNPNDENTFVICARVGDLETPINTGKMCHIVVNTPEGAEMRSRFWLGHIATREGNETIPSLIGWMGNTLFVRYVGVSDTMAHDLMVHAQEERSKLAKLLPTIYLQD